MLGNVGPDEPFGGGEPGVDFEMADQATTGQVLQFRVVAATSPDNTTPPAHLVLPEIAPLPEEIRTRPLALIEEMGMGYDADGHEVEGPLAAVLGTVEGGEPQAKMWMDAVNEMMRPYRIGPVQPGQPGI